MSNSSFIVVLFCNYTEIVLRTCLCFLYCLILILGGFDDNSPLDSVECFDPDANLWTMVQNMTSCRGGVGSATLGK
ncbi:MAG: hypothetical protein IT281_10420 [Ignavibacteria bacterium]|nr:hypothetical protein [Ignavibacteria bacterium]